MTSAWETGSHEAEALPAAGRVWPSLPPVARPLPGTQPCTSPQLLLDILGGFEVSTARGDAVEADPEPCLFWLCLVGMCSGVTPRLCFGRLEGCGRRASDDSSQLLAVPPQIIPGNQDGEFAASRQPPWFQACQVASFTHFKNPERVHSTFCSLF